MGSSLEQLYLSSHLYGENAPYIEAYYEAWLDDPASVPDQWRTTFESMPVTNGDDRVTETGHLQIQEQFRNLKPGYGHVKSMLPVGSTAFTDHKQAGVLNLIEAYRLRGHENAKLNPLGMSHHPPVRDLDLDFHDLDDTDLDHEFDTGNMVAPRRMSLGDIRDLCERVYCASIGIEYIHIPDTKKHRWLEERLEGSGGIHTVNNEERLRIMSMLTAAEGLEKFLHTRYVGQKRFSLEGGDSLIPLLHETMLHVGSNGIEEVVLGMAHRGRLNVLINIFGKSPAMLIAEFEGKRSNENEEQKGLNYSGDVKYHLGFSSDIATRGGPVHMAMAFNPSHLEIVDPVVVGSVKARQTRRNDLSQDKVMPILIHGDAAFSGQGVVMELFQMSETRGFAVGGTLHIVINNQIGFTMSERTDARSTLYCTAIAKMVHAPIFHVNGDDPEAVHHVMKIACDFRAKFKRDVVIDLVCYRRHGHNEADEPAATQPLMYQTIRKMKTPRARYSEVLESRGLLGSGEAQKLMDAFRAKLDAEEQVADVIEEPLENEHAVAWSPFTGDSSPEEPETAIPVEQAVELANKLLDLPEGFSLHPRVQKIIDNRHKMAAGEIRMDWGFAETLAYASLAEDGFSLRLVGQDSGRGTFFHRHAVLHHQGDGSTHLSLQKINPSVDVRVIDSLLSEEAVMAFEYGYASAAPDTLVLWEGQFGDFANGAQVVIDQFLSSGEAKWGRLCGLVLFLPHGYEGQGPEHSSARLERFLQLCSHGNIQVCIPSTPAQMFHLLRRQMMRATRKPLIVMTPKSMLRNPDSTSVLELVRDGSFRQVIRDRRITDKKAVQRVILCSGKVWYDLDDLRSESGNESVALVRIEQLHPFPEEKLVEVLKSYPAAGEVVWCQEEPKNQGAWYQIRHHLQACLKSSHKLFYVGREVSASPAVGKYHVHLSEQQKLVTEALTAGQGDIR